MKQFIERHALYFAWIQSLVATIGSLYFSEVLKYPPCVLCWYQRICMYPLVLILATGIVKKDRQVIWYSLPLAVVGWAIALYHNLLYYKILPESITPCTTGVSCTTKFISWFGFVTIPLLSLTAFTIVGTFLLIWYKKKTTVDYES